MGTNLPPDPAPDAATFWPEVTPEESRTLDAETFTIAARRSKVAALYCTRKSMRDIAAELSCSYWTVQNDLQVVFAGWKRAAIRSMAEHLADALMRLAHREADIADQWERSKGATTETYTGRRQGGKGGTEEAKVRKRERYGDPRLAALLLQCWDRRCRLLGLLRAEDFRNPAAALPPVKYVAGLDPAEVV